MLPINLDIDDLDSWFKEEAIKGLVIFATQVASIMDEVEEQEESLSSFEETLFEKMMRDVKAHAYDRIEEAVTSII